MTFISIMVFLPNMEAINLGEVSFFFIWDVVGVCRRRVLASYTSTPRTSTMVLVLFLVNRRRLLSGRWFFHIRCIKRGVVGELILFIRVFLLLLGRFVLLGTSWVYVAGTERWLEHYLCLRIDGFLHDIFPGFQVPALEFQLGPNKKSQAL